MGKRRDLKLRRKKRKMRRSLESGTKKEEENELGKSLVQVAGVEYKEVEKIEEKTTRVEKKGEKSERKREKRVPDAIFHKVLICFDFKNISKDF